MTDETYRMSHRAPSREDDVGAPIYDMTRTYPKDFYENPRPYAGYFPEAARESFTVIKRVRNKPEATLVIYRAVPKGIRKINDGDWVTPSLTYAKQHGRSNLSSRGEWEILRKTVKAKHVFTEGNDINEFGYDPGEEE